MLLVVVVASGVAVAVVILVLFGGGHGGDCISNTSTNPQVGACAWHHESQVACADLHAAASGAECLC